MKLSRFILISFLGLILIFFLLLLVRLKLPRQIDDINPQIACEASLIAKSQVLMVIPIFNNISIAENKEWCNYIISLNKTLGMHGVYHSYQEFLYPRDEDYINLGVREFEKCFNISPGIFEAPQVALSKENAVVLGKMNFTLYNSLYQLTHKVYHCSNTGMYSNTFMEWF